MDEDEDQKKFDFDQVTFNSELANQAKEEGMAAAEAAEQSVLEIARGIARTIAARQVTLTADDVQAELIKRGHGPLGNAAGSLFRGPAWKFTG